MKRLTMLHIGGATAWSKQAGSVLCPVQLHTYTGCRVLAMFEPSSCLH